MLLRRKSLSTPIDTTAAGIDADTVIPANNPKYAFAPASTTESKTPKITALTVISGNDCPCKFISHLFQLVKKINAASPNAGCHLASY